MNTTSDYDYSFDIFNQISAITVTTTAVIFNSIVLVILTKPEFRKIGLFRYFFVITIFDTINSSTTWPTYYPNFFLIYSNDISCKLYYFLTNIVSAFSSWAIVLTSFDTFFAVKYAMKYQFRKKLKFQVAALIVVFFFSCLLSVPYIVFPILLDDGTCGTGSYNLSFYINLYYSISCIFIPFILNNIANYLSVRKLVMMKKNSTKKNLNKAKNLFKISLGMNLFYLFCNLPLFTTIIIYNLLGTFSDLVLNILNLLTYFYSSINIIIYYISNNVFRKYCLKIVKDFFKSIQKLYVCNSKSRV